MILDEVFEQLAINHLNILENCMSYVSLLIDNFHPSFHVHVWISKLSMTNPFFISTETLALTDTIFRLSRFQNTKHFQKQNLPFS